MMFPFDVIDALKTGLEQNPVGTISGGIALLSVYGTLMYDDIKALFQRTPIEVLRQCAKEKLERAKIQYRERMHELDLKEKV